MNYWLHRISHFAEVAHPLLEKGYLSIGWSDFSTSEFVEESCKENGWNYFDKTIKKAYDNFLPRSRYTLWRFIVEMKKGDWVVVPSWGTFSIYEIEDDRTLSTADLSNLVKIQDWSGNSIEIGKSNYLYNIGIKDDKGETPIVDLGFFKKVKPIKIGISRYEYADASLTSRMKIRQTNTNINDLKESIEKAFTANEKKKPLNIYSQILEKASKQILETIQSELTPDKFELLVKWYFERIGATNLRVPSKNERDKEGDADVVATFESIKTIIYTQVKFYRGETSSWAIEQINDYKTQKDRIDDGYSKIAWVVSSSENYSVEAREKAKEANIQLFDGITFAQMLLEAGFANLDGAI